MDLTREDVRAVVRALLNARNEHGEEAFSEIDHLIGGDGDVSESALDLIMAELLTGKHDA